MADSYEQMQREDQEAMEMLSRNLGRIVSFALGLLIGVVLTLAWN